MKNVATIITLCAVLFGCSSSGPPVDFILPDGFRGIFVIIPDSEADPMTFRDGRYVVHIPESGILFVANVEPFNKWHTQTAYYSSGIQLPIGIISGNEDKVALRSLSTSSDGRISWLVGTKAEEELAWKSIISDLPLAEPLIPPDKE
jgi:hypothetical protein